MLDFFSKDPSKIVEKSSKLRLEGKYDKAEQLLKKNMKNSSQDFPLLLELGQVYFEINKLIEAIESFRNAYYLKTNEISKIINVVEDVHYRAKLKKYTGLFLIELYLKKRNLDKINKIIDTLSLDEIKELANQYDKKVEQIKKSKMPDQLTKKDIEVYLITGILLAADKQIKKAKMPLEIIFKIHSKERNFILQFYMGLTKYSYGNPDPYLAIGDLYLIINDKDKAINYFQKATMIDDSLKELVAKKFEETITNTEDISESSKYSLADLYINKEDFNKAIDILSGILNENSGNSDEVIKKLRYINQKKNSIPETYKLLVIALSNKKDFEGVVINLNKLYELTQNENDFILTNVDKLISENYFNNDLYVLKAKILVKNEKYNDAANILNSLYDKDKNSAFEIEEILNSILEKNSDNLAALSLISELFYSRNQIPKIKTLLNYILQFEDKNYIKIAEKYYALLIEKLPEDSEIKLNYSISLLKLHKIKEAKDLITQSIKSYPELFYEIIPNFYEPASQNVGIAKGIIEIMQTIDSSKVDDFLYNFTLAELYYNAEEITLSLDKSIELLKKYPDKEENILGIVNRMKEKFPENIDINEFEFKYYIAKKDYDKALQSTLNLYKNNHLIGHVLDNLYILYKGNPHNLDIMENILKVLDEMGMYEKIIAEGKTFLKEIHEDKSGLIRFYLGKAHAKKSNIEEAAGFIFQAFTLHPPILDKSIMILNDLLKIDYTAVKVHYFLAHAYQLVNNMDKAVDEMMEIYKLDKNQTKLLIKDLSTFYQTSGRNPKLTFALGKLFIANNDYHNGLGKFQETIEISEEYIDTILNELKNLQQNENVESGEVLYTMGVLYMKKKLYKMASEYLYSAMSTETSLRTSVLNQLQTIVEKEPNEITARQSLAQIYMEMTNYVQAIEYLREIETINPQEIPTVITYYEDMLNNDKDNTLLLITLGDSYLKTQNTKKAIEVFDKAFKIDKNQIEIILDKLIEYTEKDLDIQFFLSKLYAENNDFENAINWLNSIYVTDRLQIENIKTQINKILQQSPHQQNALMLLSLIYYDNEEYDKLIKLVYDVFDKSTVQTMKFRMGMLLAQAHRKLNQEDKALDIIDKMKAESRNFFYTIVIQLYEEEKSKKIYKLQNKFNKDPQKEEIRIEYAKYLISQKNYDEARKLLIHKFNDENNEFERRYLLSKINELNNNLVFALEIATPLRYSKKDYHIFFLIKLLRKLGYYGEIESILKEKPEFAITLNRHNLSKNIFSGNKIIT